MKLKCYTGHTSEVYHFYFEVLLTTTCNKHSAALRRKCILAINFFFNITHISSCFLNRCARFLCVKYKTQTEDVNEVSMLKTKFA